MMFKVEIRSSSYIENGNGIKTWWDHTGKTENKIDKFVFSKEYHEEYIPGYYPIESFGSLYRNIDNFCESPIQALTDWEITIPSIYSSKDGSFSTVDLIYHLEAINEKKLKENEENYSEFLIGCEAVLYENGDIIYRGVVNSISSGSGSTSISIGERLGAPEIPKSDIPLSLENSGMQYWSVEVITNDLRHDVIKISEKTLGSFNGFYIYLEKYGGYVRVYFNNSPSFKTSYSYKELVYNKLSEIAKIELDSPLSAGEPFIVSASLKASLRKSGDGIPDYYIAESAPDVFELIQAWSNLSYFPSSDYDWWDIFYPDLDENKYSLGRSLNQVNHRDSIQILKSSGNIKDEELNFQLTNLPESLTINGGSTYPLPVHSYGIPDFFIRTSKTKVCFNDSISGQLDWEKYPNVRLPRLRGDVTGDSLVYERNEHKPYANFTIKFPKLDLPSTIRITECTFEFMIKNNDIFEIFSKNQKVYNSTDRRWDRDIKWESFKIEAPESYSVEDFETVTIRIQHPVSYSEEPFDRLLALIGFRMHLKISMPLGDTKLYASGTIANWDYGSGQQSNYVIPSINGLLAAANIEPASTSSKNGYSVQKIGELNEIKYGNILHNETAKFRDKLRSLAAESATLVKFSQTENKLLVKSVSRQLDEKIIPITIGMDAIVLENNLFDFKMESSHRDDVLKGISLHWGKDTESGKYKHSFVLDSLEFCIDGECYGIPLNSVIGDKWGSVKYRLGINSNLNIGTTKSINCEWITNLAGAELFAYNYLCWNCAPLRKAQANCIFPVLKEKYKVDIGDFVSFELPGYPQKFMDTTWIITGMQDDLDNMVTTLELLETWNMPVVPKNRFLLLENRGNIFMETEEKIKLEGLNG